MLLITSIIYLEKSDLRTFGIEGSLAPQVTAKLAAKLDAQRTPQDLPAVELAAPLHRRTEDPQPAVKE